jgi:hypothetical protein
LILFSKPTAYAGGLNNFALAALAIDERWKERALLLRVVGKGSPTPNQEENSFIQVFSGARARFMLKVMA